MAVRISLTAALAVLLAGTLLLAPAQGYSRDSGLQFLTPGQAGNIAVKNAQLAGPPASAGPGTPVTPINATIRTSRAEALQRWSSAWSRAQSYIGELERNVGPAAAQVVRDDLMQQKARIDAMPDGEFLTTIPAVHAGTHSITFSQYAYKSDGVTASDPIGVVFYGRGESPNVAYRMQNSTRLIWGMTSCGSDLWGYTWETSHGGTDGWATQDYHLERENGWCGTPRYHLRLFDRGYIDTHGEFGAWSFSEPHHDNLGHGCVDDWEGAQLKVRDSFTDSSGNLLWFVGTIWTANFGNGGPFGCATADSTGYYIKLTN